MDLPPGTITEQDALRAHFGAVGELALRKTLPRLDPHCRRFIGLSPLLVLATSDGRGGVDASPRGDAPGFVEVIDDSTLLVPDRPGNRRVDSFRNVLESPGVGLLFFVPGINETLRVNGSARVITDTSLLERVPAQGKVPVTGLVVDIAEAFFHCGKALIRSKLWDPDTRIERSSFPSLGRIIADQLKTGDAAAADRAIEESYRLRLY